MTLIVGTVFLLIYILPYVAALILIAWFVIAVYQELAKESVDEVHQVVTISVQLVGDRVDIHASGNGDIPRAKDIP